MFKDILTRLMVILTVVSIASCNEALEVGGSGYGYLGVSLEQDSSVISRAISELAPEESVSVSIYDENGDAVIDPTVYAYSALADARYHLPVGTYTVKVSTGSNQQAAWDSPFYYGETKVTVYAERDNLAEIVCTLANVKVTVEFEDKFDEYFTSYEVYVDNGDGEGLTFSTARNTIDREGYFAVTGILTWKLSLNNNDGKSYVTSGTIEGVEAQQHYPLTFKLSEVAVDENGNAAFKVMVDDSVNEKEYNTTIDFSEKGDLAVETNGFDNTNMISVPQGDTNPKTVTKTVSDGVASALIGVDQAAAASLISTRASSIKWYELVNASQATIDELASMGIKVEALGYGVTEFTVDITEYLSRLSLGNYSLTIAVYDTKGQALETPLNFNIISNVEASALKAVPYADAAVLEAKWYADEKPAGMTFEYATLADTSSWTSVDMSALVYDEANKKYSATVTGLVSETAYLFRPVTDNEKGLAALEFKTPTAFTVTSLAPWAKFAVVKGTWNTLNQPEIVFNVKSGSSVSAVAASRAEFSGNSFVADLCGIADNTSYELESVSCSTASTTVNKSFTTGTAGTVYNLSFDEWYQDGKVWYPFADGAQHAWDSANEGAAGLIGSSTTPAEGADAVSGKAVKMESKYAVIAFAAGNLYTGDFDKLAGVGAELDWGIPFASKPVALKGYYKYAPKTIDKTGDGQSHMKGQPDKAQIQMCLCSGWTKPFHVNTKEGNFVNFNGSDIMAYGKLESEAAYSDYVEFVIPLEYRNNQAVPSYVVISAAASYLGDYFTGGVGSTLYVDEFELVYDIAELTDEQAAKVNYR